MNVNRCSVLSHRLAVALGTAFPGLELIEKQSGADSNYLRLVLDGMTIGYLYPGVRHPSVDVTTSEPGHWDHYAVKVDADIDKAVAALQHSSPLQVAAFVADLPRGDPNSGRLSPGHPYEDAIGAS